MERSVFDLTKNGFAGGGHRPEDRIGEGRASARLGYWKVGRVRSVRWRHWLLRGASCTCGKGFRVRARLRVQLRCVTAPSEGPAWP